jgi:hypothetical protein
LTTEAGEDRLFIGSLGSGDSLGEVSSLQCWALERPSREPRRRDVEGMVAEGAEADGVAARTGLVAGGRLAGGRLVEGGVVRGGDWPGRGVGEAIRQEEEITFCNLNH